MANVNGMLKLRHHDIQGLRKGDKERYKEL